MKFIKPLEQLERKYSINRDEFIGRGNNGKAFRLGNGLLAKVPYNNLNGYLRNDRQAIENVFREYNLHQLALDLGLKFPKLNDIYAIQEIQSGEYFPGLVMQDLCGCNFKDLDPEKLAKARKLRDLEIKKVEDAGLFFVDNKKGNVVWTEAFNKEGEVFLIDAPGLGIPSSF